MTAGTDHEFGAGPASDRSSIPSEAAHEELGVTTLDELRAVVEEDVEKLPVEINVPSRKGTSVRYSTDLEEPLFRLWQRQTKDRSTVTGFDDLRLSQIALAHLAQAIVINDKVVLDAAGGNATFGSPDIIQMMKESALRAKPYPRAPVTDAPSAIREFFANDGQLLAVAQEVIRECGYGEEVIANAPDPTRRS